MGLKIDHVTAIVNDSASAAETLSKLLGASLVAEVALPGMAIRSLALGEIELHLINPTGPGPVADFHQRTGGGFHHLAVRVEGLDATLVDLAGRGFRALGAPIETAPGLREVFLDPATTGGLLIQLVERQGEGGELDASKIGELAAQGQSG